MNWLDIVIACLALAGLIKGLVDGLIKQAITLLALILAIFLCSRVGDLILPYTLKFLPTQTATFVAYLLAFLFIVAALILLGKAIHRMMSASPLSLLNHIAGGLVGLLLTALTLSLLFTALQIADPNSRLLHKNVKDRSVLYRPVQQIIPTLYPSPTFPFSPAGRDK